MTPRDAPETARQPARRGARLRWGLVAVVLLAAVAGGWSLYWHRMADAIERGIATWFAERRAAGWKARHAGVAVTGFPARFVVTIEQPVLAEPDGWRWQGPETVQGDASPLALDRWRITGPGDHRVVLEGGAWTIDVPIRVGGLSAEIEVDDGRLRSIDGHGEAARLAFPGGREATLDRLDFLAAEPAETWRGDGPPPTLELTLAVQDLRLPAGTLSPFGDAVSEARLRALVRAPLGTEGSLADRLAVWRDRGGVLDVPQLAGQVDPLSLDADGTVALDEALQPLAAFTVRARGAGDVVDRFAGAGLLDDDAAAAAKLTLGVIGGPDGAVRTSLTVQDRTLYVSEFAVAKLPPIDW